MDRAEDSISLGLREMACRLNLASRNFDKAAENLGRAAQVYLSGEFLRQVVESEGKAVQAAAKAGQLPIDWTASDCPALDSNEQPTERSRIYLGSDGVMVPHITQKEKQTRRDRTKAKRRRCGKKRRALPKARKGADGPFKEFKIVTLYDDAGEHRVVTVTRGDCTEAGRLMRRDAGRVGLDKADDKVGVVDGSDWIKNQIQSSRAYPWTTWGWISTTCRRISTRRATRGFSGKKIREGQAGTVFSLGEHDAVHVAKHEGYEKLAGGMTSRSGKGRYKGRAT